MKNNSVVIGDIFDVVRGGSPRPINDFITNDPDGINWIMIGDVSVGSKYITKTKKRIIPAGVKKSRMVYPGDFLLTNSMSFGRPYILQTTGCIHDGWLVLRSKGGEVNHDYMFYLLGSKEIYSELKRQAAGAVVKNLNIGIVKNIKISLPPLPVQQKIATILDTADLLKQKDKALVAKYDELCQSLFWDMFGDPVTNPKGWNKIKLDSLGKISSGSTPSRKIGEYYEGVIPWVKTTEVKGSLIVKTSECISKLALEKTSCKLNPVGSIIIAMYGQGKTRGQVGKLGIEAATNQACAVIPPSNKMNFNYLFCLLKLSYEELRQLGRGGNQPNLNGALVKSFEVISPSTDLQSKFAKRLETIEKQKVQAQASLQKSEDLFNCLLQKAFKGELVS